MVSRSLSALLWLTVAEVAKCSVISVGQNWESWDGINETNLKTQGNPPVQREAAAPGNGPFTFQTHDHRTFVAYPMGNRDARTVLSALAGLGGLGSLLGLGGVGAVGGLGTGAPAVSNQLNALLALLSLPTLPNDTTLAGLNVVQGSTAPTSPLGTQESLMTRGCPLVCSVNGVLNPLEQMAQACAAKCTLAFNAVNGQNRLGTCLQGCAKATKEDCVGTCGRLGSDADQVLCGQACNLLCPAAVTPVPQLSDLTCCITPPLLCGPKGSVQSQVQRCQGSCATSFSTSAANMVACQQACTNFPGESCRVACANRLSAATAADIGSCTAACANLCNLASEDVDFQAGISPQTLRPFCPASKLPVCSLSVGSSAIGLTRVAQQANCLNSCTAAAFTTPANPPANTPANRNICIQACALVPQASCISACTAASDAANIGLCNTACNSLCPV